MQTEQHQSLTPRIIPNLAVHDDGEKYQIRLAKAYAPAGFDFTKSFDVLYSAYFAKYDLISLQSIGLYQYLHYLAKRDEAFTQEQLAAQFKISKATLNAWLDELQNADLIERVKVSVNKGGLQNLYVIRTPYHERAALVATPEQKAAAEKLGKKTVQQRRAARIAAAGETFPETFLEDELKRLRAQIQDNAAQKRRQNLTAAERAEQKKNYRALEFELGGLRESLDFEQFVFKAYRALTKKFADNFAAIDAALREMTRTYIKDRGKKFSGYVFDLAKRIFSYYERHDRTRPATAATEPQRTDENQPAKTDENEIRPTSPANNEADELRKINRESAAKYVRHWLKHGRDNIENLVAFFRAQLENGLSIFDLQEIAADDLGSRWEQIREELIL